MKNTVKAYRGVFRQELMRLACDWKTYVCLVLYFFVCILTSTDGFSDIFKKCSALQGLLSITKISNMNKLLVLIAAVPFAASFCDDWKGKYINYIVIRSNRLGYITAKLSVCVVSSFGISFTGLIIYSAYNVARAGIGADTLYEGALFYDFVVSSIPFLAVIAESFLFALVSCVYAVMGYALSAVIPNRFVAITGSLFMNVFMEQIMNYFPRVINLFRIQGGNTAFNSGSLGTILFSILVSAGYITVFGLIFGSYAGRRLRNEIV